MRLHNRHTIFVLFSFVIGCCMAVASAFPGKAIAVEGDATFVQVWEARLHEIDVIESETNDLMQQLQVLEESSKPTIKKAQATATNLLNLFKASRRLPSEQLVFVYQMQRLATGISEQIVPLTSIEGIFTDHINNIQKQHDDIGEMLKGFSLFYEQGATEQDKQFLVQALSRLQAAKKQLSTGDRNLKKILNPAQELEQQLNDTVVQIKKDLPAIWVNYYRTQSDLNVTSTIKSSMASNWISSLSSRLIFMYPMTLEDWYAVGRSFLGALLVFAVSGGILSLLGQKIALQRRESLKKYVLGPFLWIIFGVAISAASFDAQGGLYLSFFVIGILFLVWGVVKLGWRLRWIANPALTGKISPIAQMFPVATLGIILLQSDTPAALLSLIWFLIIGLFTLFMYSKTIKHMRGQENQPLLEQFVYSSSFIVSTLSLITTIVGYARLAVLGFIFLIAITNFVLLGSSITAFIQEQIDRLIDKVEHPVKNSMVQVCNVPFSWFLAFGLSMPWVWAVPGSVFLIEHMMHTGYTFGGTSIDFGKIFFILLLFILFRSITSLASSSLELIAQRVSHIEEGVIPPLQNLIVYGLWTVFGLVSLAVLGVSLTSLAVVAGGLSVGIGFGMQNIFNNLISGILLIFGRTVLVGDYIEVDGILGTVRAISIRSTSIETSEMALVYVPNSVLMSSNVINWTRNNHKVRRTISITIMTDNDFSKVAESLKQIAHAQKHVVAFIDPTVQLAHLGLKTMRVELTVVIDNLTNSSATLSDIREEIQKTFTLADEMAQKNEEQTN